MRNNINNFVRQERSKVILLLMSYILFSELIKTGAEIYILEQSFEFKLFLFSLAVVLLYDVPDRLIVISVTTLLLLSVFGVQVGFMIYVFISYATFRLFRQVLKQRYE